MEIVCLENLVPYGMCMYIPTMSTWENTSCFKTNMQEHNVRNINFIHWWSCEVFITFIDRIGKGIFFHQGLGQSTNLQGLFSIISYNKKKRSCEENSMIVKGTHCWRLLLFDY